MKNILLMIEGRDKPLQASVGTDANDPAAWLHNARECAWEATHTPGDDYEIWSEQPNPKEETTK